MGSKLVGCGSAVPKLQISNDDLAQFVETSDEWISVRTGIRNRRVLTGNILSAYYIFIQIIGFRSFSFSSFLSFWVNYNYPNTIGSISLTPH